MMCADVSLRTQEFKDVQKNVREWIKDYVLPTISNASDRFRVFSLANQSGAHLRLQGGAHGRSIDFMTASSVANTDQDILNTIIFDFLARRIFSNDTVYGHASLKSQMDLISVLEMTMAADLNISKGECQICGLVNCACSNMS